MKTNQPHLEYWLAVGLTASLTILSAGNSHADELPSGDTHAENIKWVIGAGLDFGGDKLGTVFFTNGDTADVRANQGVVLYAGAVIANGVDSPFETQLTIGYKFGGPSAKNGDVTWSSFPLEAIQLYRMNNFRMGLGLSYHMDPKLDVSMPNANFTDHFDDALGVVLQAGWMPAEAPYSVDLRYTVIQYKYSLAPSGVPDVDGNSLGLYGSYRF